MKTHDNNVYKSRVNHNLKIQYEFLGEVRAIRKDLNRMWSVILIVLAANLGVNVFEVAPVSAYVKGSQVSIEGFADSWLENSFDDNV